ncbi:MAG: 50S ribosomal protein L29 [Elusimicrobia bacterium RIFOXYC2_FULL_34_12]|nr:MAG: 50S ribosomal protein L29 [Elusimicrobia bacterium RIFOXYC2_FULL_34_12]OGS38581.1 MAG: 50S ribosomal protein L29 [Elusimicrobia bacterium RIFOXYD2_FULL_34_30]HAM38850.1 50S ribosomal protein L29 [Elusimicrobiota bacterium]
MAKEKKEINIKELTDTELKSKLLEAREKLFKLKFSHKSTPLKNPLEIRIIRKQIAKILTILKEKELNLVKK